MIRIYKFILTLIVLQAVFYIVGSTINILSEIMKDPSLSWMWGDFRYAIDSMCWTYVTYKSAVFYFENLKEFRSTFVDCLMILVGLFCSSNVVYGIMKSTMWLTHSDWKTVDVNKLIGDTFPQYGLVHISFTTMTFGILIGLLLCQTTDLLHRLNK